MRKEPFTVGDYVHIYNRGNRKMPIVYDENDKWRFLKILRYFNDEYSPQNIFRQIQIKSFSRPAKWPPSRPLVKILCFCLMPNHFHLLLKEIKEDGISKFMKKLGDGFTNYINTKYKESGKVFQGSYKARTVKKDEYLQYLDIYIQVLNPIELYPGGIEKATKEFNKAFEFATNYSFCSLPDIFGERNLLILDRDILEKSFPNPKIYKEFVYDALLVRNTKEILGKLTID